MGLDLFYLIKKSALGLEEIGNSVYATTRAKR